MPRPAIPVEHRFFNRLKIEGDCVVWTGGRNKAGYGIVGIEGRKVALAHRVSWRLKYGCWPNGDLRHSCDNPPCVRIKHLSEGTSQQNSDDMVERGRQLWGERIPTSKLTEEQVREIRELGEWDIPRQDIADHYKVHVGTIQSIVLRRIWALLDPDAPRTKRKGGRLPKRFEVDGEMLTILEIAGRAGVNSHTIGVRIAKGLTGHDLIAGKHRAKRKEYTRA